MAPLTTGAPPVTAHAIHAKANQHAAKKGDRHGTKQKGHQHGARKKSTEHRAPKKSKSPKLPARHTTKHAKKAVRRTTSYQVRPGDNLTAIAARHGVSLSALIKANHIGNPNLILRGSSIRIPHRAVHPRATEHHRPKRAAAHHHKKTAAKHHEKAATHHKKTSHHEKPATHHKKASDHKKSTHRKKAQHRSKVDKTRSALAGRKVPTRTQTKKLIEKTARHYGVSPKLALGIGWQESGWNQRAVSPVNAIGAMQVMPQSGEWASTMVGRKLNLLDAHDNVTAGVAILRYLTSNARDLDQAIGGYYQGLGAMREFGPYPDTRQYIRNVRALMNRL